MAAAMAESLDRKDELSRMEHKLGSVHQRRGEWDLAASHFAAALSKTGAARERARLIADWSLVAHHGGDPNQAQKLAEEAMILAESAGDRRALAQAHNLLGILASSQKNLDTAKQHYEESLALSEESSDLSARVAAMNNLSLAYNAAGERDQAMLLVREALNLCQSMGDRHREAALHNNLADLLHAQGRSEDAMEHLKQSVAIYAEIGGDREQ